MAKLYNLARMTVTGTPGTGTITLNAAVSGYLTFAQAGIANGDIVSYGIKDGVNSEIGTGAYTTSGTTLTRTVTKSTNSNAAISATSAAEVFITARAEDFSELALELRNRVLNPSGALWQVQNTGAAALTDVTYAWDQWYALTQSNGVTGSTLTAVENTTPNMMRLSQANASAQRFGLCQPLASADVIDLRGQPVALSARVRMSASTTLRYAIVEWTGTADSPTKDIVNDWTSGTFTTSNFFISTTTTIVATGSVALTANTIADITTLTGSVSSSMNNLLVFFWTDSTQAQNVTLDIGKVQLTYGSFALPFMPRTQGQELSEAMRFYEKTYDLTVAPGTVTTAGQFQTRAAASSVFLAVGITFMVPKNKVPTMTVYNPNSGSSASAYDQSAVGNVAVSSINGVGARGFSSLTTGVTFTGSNLYNIHYVADARM